MSDTGFVKLNFASGDDMKFQLDQLCQHIQNPDRRLRQGALQKLLDYCESSLLGHQLRAQQAADVFSTMYIPLIRCYSDRYEQCRTLTIGIISSLIIHMPTNSYYIDSIIPVIGRRIGQPEIIEPSEEVRLHLMKQLLLILGFFHESTLNDQLTDNGSNDCFLQCHNIIMDVLLKTLTDPYPVIQRTCCECINAFAKANHNGLTIRANELITPLIALLGHRHSPTRIVAVSALGNIAMHLRVSDDIVRCIVAISPLLMDEQALVRRECGRVGCRWLVEMRDRYSFFERLIPLALCGLSDNCPETRADISSRWLHCGEQYYRENEQELSRIEIVDRPDELPEDLVRPSLGCRAIVQRSLRVCKIVCKEMSDWNDEVRIHSLRVLRQIVLHAERSLTAMFVDIFHVLLRYCVYPVRMVSDEALQCAALLGMLIHYDDWIEHALTELRRSPHHGQLKCFVVLFSKSKSIYRHKHLGQILQIIIKPTVSRSLDYDYQNTLVELIENIQNIYMNENNEELVDKTEGYKSIEEMMYIVITEVRAICDGSKVYINCMRLDHCLDKLASGDLAKLHIRYLPSLLQSLHEDFEARNSDNSEPVVLLYGIIRLVGFKPLLLEYMSKAVYICIRNSTCCGRIKILSALSFSMLRWSVSMCPSPDSFDKSVVSLRTFLSEIIEPFLLWQAGRNAEALRIMATSVLRASCTGARNEVKVVFPELADYWIQLVDDKSVLTRACALGCLFNCGPFQLESLKSISLAVLSRLDDPSNEVRELAVIVLSSLQLRDTVHYEHESWHLIIQHIISTMFLYLQCPDLKQRTQVTDALVIICRKHRKSAHSALQELPIDMYHHVMATIQNKLSNLND